MSHDTIIDRFEGPFRFLSNFYCSPGQIWVEHPHQVGQGLLVDSVEHAFAATKTTDARRWAAICAAPTPGAAKRAGRAVPLRPDWEQIKLAVMQTYLRQKFDPGRQPALVGRLLSTAPARLIEGNSWGDVYWGVCRGRGDNHLGLLLMDLREELGQ